MSDSLKAQKIAALLKTIKAYDVRLNIESKGLFAPKLAPMGFLKVFHPTGLGLGNSIDEYSLPISDYEGFSVYCSAQDNPGGRLYQQLNTPNGYWEHLGKLKSNLTKPSSGLATFSWSPSDTESDLDEIKLCTEAYALVSGKLIKDDDKELENRPEDVVWAQEKFRWLWLQTFPALRLPEITLMSIERRRKDDDY